MTEITVDKLMELYIDTLQKCDMQLLETNDDWIGYCIFEEFDIGAISFLHNNVLSRLKQANLITENIAQKSSLLREKFMKLQNTELWNINSVKHSKEWKEIFELSEEIRLLLK